MPVLTAVMVGNAESECARLGSAAMHGDGGCGAGTRVGCIPREHQSDGEAREEAREETARDMEVMWGFGEDKALRLYMKTPDAVQAFHARPMS